MTSSADELLNCALSVESPDELDALWDELAVHACHQRPVGDRWGNRGMFTAAGGTFDHKLVELVTNMHDALAYFEVARRNPSADIDEVRFAALFSSPREAVEAVFAGWTRTDLAQLAAVELRGSGEKGAARRDRTIVFRDRGIGMAPDDFPTTLLRVGSSRQGRRALADGSFWSRRSGRSPELSRLGRRIAQTARTAQWSCRCGHDHGRSVEPHRQQTDGDGALPSDFAVA